MDIRVFSTKFCPECIALKQFLKQKNIEFKDIDVSENKQALEEMIEKSGQMGVPVLEIDNEVIAGFDKKKISNLLNIKD